MDLTSIIALLVSLLMSLLCCGGGIFFFLLVIGVIMLRRRGKKNITAKEAVATGVESVSQVFTRRADGGLDAGDDD